MNRPHPSSLADAVALFRDFAKRTDPSRKKELTARSSHAQDLDRLERTQAQAQFKALTGHSRFVSDCLCAWARDHADRLVEDLSPGEYVDLATWAAGHRQPALLAEMVARVGEVVQEHDSEGRTVFHAAAWAYDTDALRFLIPHWEEDEQPRDQVGRLVLECLLLPRRMEEGVPWRPKGWEAKARKALRAVYDLAPHWIGERTDQGNTLLHIAAGAPRPRVICQDLAGFGLAWDAANAAGFTPAHVLEHNQAFQERIEKEGDPKDREFLDESLAAGARPRHALGLMRKLLARLTPQL